MRSLAEPRLNRLFAADGRCLDVAVDHGLFGEPTFLAGIEDMTSAVATLVSAGPDAIQLAPGQAHLLQGVPGPSKPALVLRADVANIYGRISPEHLFSRAIEAVTEAAVRLDAACVVVNILAVPSRPELLEASLRNVMMLRDATQRVGMPLMVEPLAMRSAGDAYGVDGALNRILPLVRQAAELGADVIKADPTDDLGDYGRVIEVAGGRPVLPRGGGRAPTGEILKRTEELMKQGAAGIVYGRNIIQHPNPSGMTRALMAIVHDGASAADAQELCGG